MNPEYFFLLYLIMLSFEFLSWLRYTLRAKFGTYPLTARKQAAMLSV